MKLFCRLVSFCLILFLYHASFAQDLTISGELTDVDGNIVGETTPFVTDVVVTVYNQEQNESPLYTETFLIADDQSVTVHKGIFTLTLGQGTTSDDLAAVVATDEDLWIGITVDGDVLSRAPMTGFPYVIPDHAGLHAENAGDL